MLCRNWGQGGWFPESPPRHAEGAVGRGGITRRTRAAATRQSCYQVLGWQRRERQDGPGKARLNPELTSCSSIVSTTPLHTPPAQGVGDAGWFLQQSPHCPIALSTLRYWGAWVIRHTSALQLCRATASSSSGTTSRSSQFFPRKCCLRNFLSSLSPPIHSGPLSFESRL